LGKLYKPTKLQELESKRTSSDSRGENSSKSSSSEKPAKKKGENKKKSNLELFKEELKLIQEEREERHRLKAQLKETGKIAPKPEPEVSIKLGLN
jgi:U2-associated protein SR140